MAEIFFEIAIIVVSAVILGIMLRALKQPLILAYIFAGILIGPVFNLIKAEGTIEAMSHLGIALLLFLVGVELNIREMKHLGLISIVTGVGQFIFAFIAGYFLLIALGFTSIEAIFIAVALTFSSTIIIVKLLSEQKSYYTLHGRIAIGFLIVQDFLAVIVLMILSGSNGHFPEFIGINLLKGVGLILAAMLSAFYILPPIFRRIANNKELLFLGSIAWCFLYGIAAQYVGFSVEIGAFLAGISLAPLPYRLEISSRIKPLRNFFITIFFVVLGTQLGVSLTSKVFIPSVILAVFVLIADPLIIMVLMGIFGYRKKTSFLTGLTSAQISEFSLIIISIAHGLGYISQKIVSVVTMAAVITIVASSYLIIYSHHIYPKISGLLRIFERRNLRKEKKYEGYNNHVILFGYHRLGYHITKVLQKMGINFLVVDIDPAAEKILSKIKIPHVYGDASDPEILESICLSKADLVISTIPDFNDNMIIINKVKVWKKTKVIVTANQMSEAIQLYEAGADYVILPHFLGGEKLESMLEGFIKDSSQIPKVRTKHLSDIYEHIEHHYDTVNFQHAG